MSVPVYKPDEQKYLLQSYDMGECKRGIKIRFSDSLNTSLAKVYANGTHISTVALSSSTDDDTAFADILPQSGVCDIEIRVTAKHVKLLDVEFTIEGAFEHNSYVPIPEEAIIDNGHDTWEATDMLGRKVPSVEDVGAKRADKKVGLFYWTWREHAVGLTPINVSKLLSEYPSAEYNRDHPGWQGRSIQPHWGEPRFGFYRNSDPYVIRHHAVMLANAGVDFLLFDCTNGALLWRDAYEPFLKGLYEARKDGINVPKIAFMLNFWKNQTTEYMLRALYQDLYKPGRYSDLWFMLDGKPMVMAIKESLPETGDSDFDTALLNDIREFFSFRAGQPLYGRDGGGPLRPDHWGWLEIFPQHKFGEREDGSCEMMTVGVGQNANDELICTHFNNVRTYGRSYTAKFGHSLLSKDSYKYGYNVQEQWDRVHDISPDNVFVTGWNEWMMGLFKDPWVKDPDSTQLAMVDQYDSEHSRDIEPDKDGYLDTYYLQLAANIRRFKGASQRVKASEEKTVTCFEDFDGVLPEYRADKGITIHRNWPGFKGYHYKNDSGRNEIIMSKVARDSEFLYFFAECSSNITEPEGEGWMTLFIDSDRSKKTGWEGYDLAVNRLCPDKGKAYVEAYLPTAESGSFTWQTIGTADLTYAENKLILKIERSLVSETGKLDFEFKWSDNMVDHDVMDFYENGCSAPYGRFNYLYKE